MLFKERDHFVDVKVGQHQFTIGQCRSAGLSGDFLHVEELGRIGDHIDFFEGKAFALEIGDSIDAPRAAGLDVNN